MQANIRLRQALASGRGLLVLLAVGGCRKHHYTEVEGKVTLNGKPLSGVKVTFYPESEGDRQLPYAFGTTDAAGMYTLTLSDGKPGALQGPNRVVVKRPLAERQDVSAGPPPEPSIPLQYTVVIETPLIFEVMPGARQTIDLELQE